MTAAGEQARGEGAAGPSLKRVVTLGFANAGGALAWSVQLSLDYALAGFACAPRGRPLAHVLAGWIWSRPTLTAVNLLALAVSVAAFAVGWREWRRRPESPGQRDAEELGENWDGFLALSGVMIGAAMIAAVLFNTVALLGTPRCNG